MTEHMKKTTEYMKRPNTATTDKSLCGTVMLDSEGALNKRIHYSLDQLASRKSFYILLFLISFLYLLLGCNRGLNLYDEGLIVSSASRILDGGIPYRDFWSLYSPGQFYLAAMTLKLFGMSLIATRLLSVTVNSMIVFCVYLLARKILPCKYSLFSWFLILVWFAEFTMYSSPIPTSLLFSLICCFSLVKFFETKQKRWILLAGFLIGIVTLFRHDIGFYTLLSASVVVMFFSYANLSGTQQNSTKKAVAGLQNGIILFASTMAVILPVAIFFISKVPIKELFADLVLFPATVYPKFRSLPYPAPCPNPLDLFSGEIGIGRFIGKTIELVPFYMPIVFVVVSVQLARTIRKKQPFSTSHWIILLLNLLGITFFNYARIRADLWHLGALILPAAILLSSMLYFFKQNSEQYAFWRKLIIFITIMVIICFGRDFIKITGRKLGILSSATKLVPLNIDRGRGIYVQREKAEPLLQAIYFVQKATTPDEKIFVGNSRHDIISANNAMFYFLAERQNATKYYDMHPGLTTTLPVQKQIVEDLRNYNVNYIIIVNIWDRYDSELIKTGESSGIMLLDDFIKRNYTEVKRFGPYGILKSNSLKG